MTYQDWVCGYVLVEERDEVQVAALLHGRLSGQARSERGASDISAQWPSVGPAGTGWTLVIDPHFEFGDTAVELARCSVGTRVARLLVIERDRGKVECELFSHATVWADGEMAWDISFEALLDDRPTVGGMFPHDVDELARLSGSELGPDAYFRVPIIAVQHLTGWRARQEPAGATPRFTPIQYPRPVGIAAAVARDLT